MSHTSATFTTKIDLTLKEVLKEDLHQQGFIFTKPLYTIFSAKKPGVICTLYESGTLTVQGKDKQEFIEFYLEPQILKNLSFTHPELYVSLEGHIGVDEAGKGDFFGPLCVAGCFAEKEQIEKLLKIGVKDSKQMSDAHIVKLAKQIKTLCPYAVLRLFPQKYNELYQKFHNLNHLLGWGHATIITELVEKTSCKEALIDKFADESIVENALKRKNIDIHLVQRTKAEQDPVVAAASILARDAFIDGIEKLGKEISFTLPKGASSLVFEAGKTLVKKHGISILEKVAKMHFKTKDEILKALSLLP